MNEHHFTVEHGEFKADLVLGGEWSLYEFAEFIIKTVGFDFEPEVTARLLLAGHRIVEVPIGYEPRTAKEGKTIGWVDGIDAIYALLKCRFTGRRVRGQTPNSRRSGV